jgi:hypothetical protein
LQRQKIANGVTPITFPRPGDDYVHTVEKEKGVVMQTSAEWFRLFRFHLVEQRIASGLLNLGERMTRVRVFKAPRDFLMLAMVTTTYWVASATISSAILFPIVHSSYKIEALRITLALLSAIGLFVLFNEPLRGFMAGHGALLKALVSGLAALLGAAALGYWLDHKIFAAVFTVATRSPLDSIAFAASHLILLSANIILPVLGGGLVIRLARQALRPTASAR